MNGNSSAYPKALALILALLFSNLIAPEELMSLSLTSTAFSHNGSMPSVYTCEGRNLAPPLQWRNLPGGTRSLVLIVDDPDAPDPDAPKMVWVHWVLFNLPPEEGSLPEGAGEEDLPPGAAAGKNDSGHDHYDGPCPPIGTHRYFFKLYALDSALGLKGHPTKAQVVDAMKGHILEETELIGTYRKKG